MEFRRRITAQAVSLRNIDFRSISVRSRSNIERRLTETDAKEVANQIRKGLILFFKTSYRTACDHPFLTGFMLFLYLLYSSFPSLFAFLISSSPVIICTGLLLGILLSYGEPHIPEIEVEEKKTAYNVSDSVLQGYGDYDDFVVDKGDDLLAEHHAGSARDFHQSNVDSSMQVDEGSGSTTVSKDEIFCAESCSEHGDDAEANGTECSDRYVAASENCILQQSIVHNEAENVFISATSTRSAVEKDKTAIDGEEGVTEEKGDTREDILDKINLHENNISEDSQRVTECVECSSNPIAYIPEDASGVNSEIGEPALGTCLYSLLSSSRKPILGIHSISDSDSDGAESSSPDASMTDIIPMLDELHPLLDSDLSRPAQTDTDDSDALSVTFEQDGGSDIISEEGILENLEDEEKSENPEGDDEASEKKESRTEPVVSWTADDQKNLMDLGTSELERNRRLENLIAKRRARKVAEMGNLIDFSSNESNSVLDKFSHLQVQVSSISTNRKNPFDYIYGSNDSNDLPPIPGSAPSVLLRRPNPFDFHYGQTYEHNQIDGKEQSYQCQQEGYLSERFEGFAIEASNSGDSNKEKEADPSFVPYFAPEHITTREASYGKYHRQLSEMSHFRLGSFSLYEPASSFPHSEYFKKKHEEDVSQEYECANPGKCDEVAAVDSEYQERRRDIDSHSENNFDTFNAKHNDKNDSTNSLKIINEGFKCEMKSADVDPYQLKVVNEETVKPNIAIDGELTVIQQMRDDKFHSIELLSKDSYFQTTSGEEMSEAQAEILNSPRVIEKSSFDSSLLEPLISKEKENPGPVSESEYNMQTDLSNIDSTLRSIQRQYSSEDESPEQKNDSLREEPFSGGESLKLSPLNLLSTNEYDALTSNVTEVGIHDYFAFKVQKSEAEDFAKSTGSSTVAIYSMDGHIVKNDMNENIDVPSSVSHTDETIVLECLNSVPSKDVQLPLSDEVQPTEFTIDQSACTILLPLPEESAFESKQEGMELNVTKSSSLLQRESHTEIRDHGEMEKIISIPENDDSSVTFPVDFISDEAFIGTSTQPTGNVVSDNFSEHLNELVDETYELEDMVDEIEDVDEGILSELDVVGDFSVGELHSDGNQCEQTFQFHGHSDEFEMGSSILAEPHVDKKFHSQVFLTETPGEDPSECQSSLTTFFSEEKLAGSASFPFNISVEDLDLQNPSKLHVLEAKSIEDIYSVLSKLDRRDDLPPVWDSVADKPDDMPIVWDHTVDKPTLLVSDIAHAEMEPLPKNLHPIGQSEKALTKGLQPTEDDMYPVSIGIHKEEQEFKFGLIEDMHNAAPTVEQLMSESHRGSTEKPLNAKSLVSCLVDYPIEPLQNKPHLELTELHPGLHEVEVRSLEELDLVLKQESISTSELSHNQPEKDKTHLCPVEVYSEIPEIEARSFEDLDLAVKQLRGDTEDIQNHSAEGKTQLKPMEIHLDLVEVEASSLEDIDTAFKQLYGTTIKQPSDQDTKGASSCTSLEVYTCMQEVEASCHEDIHLALQHHCMSARDTASEQYIKDTQSEQDEVQSELHEVEAHCLQDINLALKNFSVGIEETTENTDKFKSSQFEDETVENSMEPYVTEQDEVQSELHEVEARCLQDINLALNNFNEGTEEKMENTDELKSSQFEVETVESSAGPNVTEQDEVQSELHEVEAHCLQDINLALKNFNESIEEKTVNVDELKSSQFEVETLECSVRPNVTEIEIANEVLLSLREAALTDSDTNEHESLQKSDETLTQDPDFEVSSTTDSCKKRLSSKSDSTSTSSSSSDSD